MNSSTYSKMRRNDRRLTVLELLGNQCAKCGSSENLEFDHIDGSTKKFNIAQILNFRWTTLLEELNKCQLLCVDCHKEKTIAEQKARPAHNKNNSPYVHGTTRMYTELKCRCDLCRAAKSLNRKGLLSYGDVVSTVA